MAKVAIINAAGTAVQKSFNWDMGQYLFDGLERLACQTRTIEMGGAGLHVPSRFHTIL